MNFLEDYKTYTESIESPEIYSVWCAFSCLSAAAQRKVWMDMDLFRITPNLYITLIGPPGRCRKGVSMGIVKELLLLLDGVKTKADSITKEAIFSSMEASQQRFELPGHKPTAFIHSSLTIFANEMSLLIKKGDKDFVSALNSLFDAQTVFKHTTKTQGENRIVNPYLNILGCTTPDWISANIHEDILEGGLSARTMLVYSNKPKPGNPFPQLSQEARVAKLRIIKRLSQIINMGGKYIIDESAKPYYENWYKTHYDTDPPHIKLTGYWHRKATHLLKLSMLMAVAHREEPVILQSDIETALKILNMSEPAFEQALKGVGRNVLNPVMTDILAQIDEKKDDRIDLAELTAKNYHTINEKEMTEIIAALMTMNKVYKEVESNGRIWIVMKPQAKEKI